MNKTPPPPLLTMNKTPPPPRWYCINKQGTAKLCTNEKHAAVEAEVGDKAEAVNAPHQAVLLGDVEGLSIVATNALALLEHLMRKGLPRYEYANASLVSRQARHALGIGPAPSKSGL